MSLHRVLLSLVWALLVSSSLAQTSDPAAPTGAIEGTVLAGDTQHALHSATVLLIPGGRSTITDASGRYEFRNLRPGSYSVIVHGPGLGDQRRNATVTAGATVTIDFVLHPAAVREQITVTATGTQETTLETIPSTTSLDSVEIVQRAAPDLGEALNNVPGVTMRGFGPGSSRPVIRGFSGDRVLVMQDGVSVGSLASQSGDHGEPIDVLNLERLEVVRGPATLLYGSNAIGGVVNTISGNFQHDDPHEGLSGYLSGIGGSANEYFGSSGKLAYTTADRFQIWAGANGQRTDDYETPIGTVPNSRTRNYGGFAGIGWTSPHAYFDFGYKHDNRKYGIPFGVFLESGGVEGGFANPNEEVINIRLKNHDIRGNGGFRDLDGFITGLQAAVNYNHYRHGEFEDQEIGTNFKNDQFNYRVTFDQRRYRRLSGSFGVSGVKRSYETIGSEALAPPTDQVSFSIFGLQTLNFDRLVLQFGGRFEHVGYDTGAAFATTHPDRSFNGASAAVGARVSLWTGGAFIANYTHSFRAPALEELYNEGPHPGNLAFEIGNPLLEPERGNGIDLSLRQESSRFRADFSFFSYKLSNYIFLAPNGLITDGLFEAEYLQAGTRYYGGEASIGIGLLNNLWLISSVDGVSARLEDNVTSPVTGLVTPEETPLPRIPPVRGRVALDWRYKGFGLVPEVTMASSQENLFTNEQRTPGHTLFGLTGSYTLTRTHAVHVFSFNAFNLGDRLYRNHVSFIKDLAPEIGRGVRFSYTVRFF